MNALWQMFQSHFRGYLYWKIRNILCNFKQKSKYETKDLPELMCKPKSKNRLKLFNNLCSFYKRYVCFTRGLRRSKYPFSSVTEHLKFWRSGSVQIQINHIGKYWKNLHVESVILLFRESWQMGENQKENIGQANIQIFKIIDH